MPRKFTEMNKQQQMQCCEQLLKRYRDKADGFLFNIVTGDKTWADHYDPEEKRQRME